MKKPKYCYLYMTESELAWYGPGHQPDYIAAMHEFESDVKEWVQKRGYKQSQLWRPGYKELKEYIKQLWQ